MDWLTGLAMGVGSFFWGPASLLFLGGAGLYLSMGTGFLPLRRGGTILKKTLGSLFLKRERRPGSITPFQAVSTALAGTMGTGNIAGVATALVAGGPGAIFWMWVSALVGMSTKYAEVFLAVRYRTKNRRGERCGGPMYYLELGAGRRGLARLFAAFCLLASFGIGNMTQVSAMADALSTTFSIPPLLTGLGTALLVGLVVFGGMNRIAAVTGALIPLLSLGYITAALWVLWQSRALLPGALSLIFTQALNPHAAVGGVAGYTVVRAMRFGVARGVFSNEAGLGSAPIAHGSAATESPVEQGLWGIVEVFIDTLLCCTLTALVLLTAGDGSLWCSGLDGASLTTAAFADTLGRGAGGFVALSILFFALSSILGWYLYGERSVDYLTREQSLPRRLYRLLFVGVTVVGAVAGGRWIWALADILNALMTLPNLIGLLLLSPVVFRETRRYFSH